MLAITHKHILIADDFHPLLMDELKAANIHFSYQPNITREGIIDCLKDGLYGLIVRSKTAIDKNLLLNASNLAFVVRGGAGMDNIDVEFAEQKGIQLFNSENANSDSVAEQTIGMLLSLLHKIAASDRQIRNNVWLREENRGTELMGKTVGIYGFGNTGSALARKLAGFNVKVLVYDKFKSGFSYDGVFESSPEQIFQEADFVSFHVPLDSHTNFMVNSHFLHSFVKKIILLNVSRGEIVRTVDVVSALENGILKGFAADVLENESLRIARHTGPDWFKSLIAMDNVILTPHVGGWSVESYKRISAVVAQNTINFLAE